MERGYSTRTAAGDWWCQWDSNTPHTMTCESHSSRYPNPKKSAPPTSRPELHAHGTHADYNYHAGPLVALGLLSPVLADLGALHVVTVEGYQLLQSYMHRLVWWLYPGAVVGTELGAVGIRSREATCTSIVLKL